MKQSLLVAALALVAVATPPAHADDACKTAANADLNRPHGPAYDTAIYVPPSGSPMYLRGDAKTAVSGKLIYYFTTDGVNDTYLGVPSTMAPDPASPDQHAVTPATGCAHLFSRRYAGHTAQPPKPTNPPPTGSGSGSGSPPTAAELVRTNGLTPATTERVVDAYLTGGTAMNANGTANSISDIANEAVQILGQIVVDRASQAAYSTLTNKVQDWLSCTDTKHPTRFPATCKAVKDLRLQDLAMAPDALRTSLIQDALTWLGLSAKNVDPSVADKVERDPIGLLEATVVRVVVPVLSRPAEALTGRTAEITVRRIVDQVLQALKKQGTNALCNQKDRDRVLAIAATAFAACQISGSSEACPVTQNVMQIDQLCTGNPLTADELAYSQTIAGNLEDAVTLKKDTSHPDAGKRLDAAVDAVFEVACMYAVDSATGPYQCDVDTSLHGLTQPNTTPPKSGPLTTPEKVAIARDVTRAAVDRDGAALATAIVTALQRILPTPDDADEPKAIRVLATITAYAATYTSDASATDAHEQRTKLLESLTADMTLRSGRGGDAIFSLGGALRVVGGVRLGHTTEATKGARMNAAMGPLSVPLGFGFDYLRAKAENGPHIELSILDLGQYLSWDQGGQIATPNVTDAFSPTITIGWAWGRELPFYLAVTGGYSPGYDFDPSSDAEKRGSWNLGVTAGIYVPLLDLN